MRKKIWITILSAFAFFLVLTGTPVRAEIATFKAPIIGYDQPVRPLADIIPAHEGDIVNFFVDPSYDITNRNSTSAVYKFTGEHAYLYIETNFLNSLAPDEKTAFLDSAKSMLDEFDARIYPIVTDTFGKPWEPGIDNDNRITILLTRLTESTAGYFNPRDEFEKSRVPESNQREMIYLNTRFIPAGRGKMFLAHEFQHLISFYWKDRLLGQADDVWLNETRSEYIPTLLGYDVVYNGSNLEHRVNTFLRNPNDSLTEWENAPADYGPIALFGQYLADQYSANIFKEMMKARSVGITSVEDALKALDTPDTFENVFANWTVANYINDILVNPRYGYFNPRLRTFRLTSTEIHMSTGSIDFALKDWSNNAFHIYGNTAGNIFMSVYPKENPFSYKVAFIRIDNGTTTVQKTDGLASGASYSGNMTPVSAFLVIPFSKVNISNFKDNEPSRNFVLGVSGSTQGNNPNPPVSDTFVPKYPESSLIRAIGDYKVYVTKGLFIRHIVSTDIFGFYEHLGFAQVIDVTPQELAKYKPSAWVRADGDTKVWEINGDATKHWINIPGEQFAPSGRDWNGVYIINNRERDWYKRGADVMK